jgi:hypothetical protein
MQRSSASWTRPAAASTSRKLLLNPPVNLYTSITNLDKLVQTEVKGINNTPRSTSWC